MNIQPERERLAEIFTALCEISSPSKQERIIASYLRDLFTSLGADSIEEDESKSCTGANVGNLIIRFNGTDSEQEGFFLSCHMDTVQPGDNVEVVRTGNIFTSKGETILGSDDKSGIAAIIETIRLLKENNCPHGMIEIILTTCEEIGLLGAKCLDFSKIKSKYGYALDSTGINRVIFGAPAANKFKITVDGKASHAGLHPEKGINAILVAAKAMANLQLGRIDHETTANIGLITGGVATNIIPEQVIIEGEVRSHNTDKLQYYTKSIEDSFRQTVALWPEKLPTESGTCPVVTIQTIAEYPAMLLDQESSVLKRVALAGSLAGKELTFEIAGGGSDANIFNDNGLATAIIATGMDKVHTTNEQLDLEHLLDLARLLLALATCGKRMAS